MRGRPACRGLFTKPSPSIAVARYREALRAEIRAELDFETNIRSEVWIEMIAEVHHLDLREVKARAMQRMTEAKAREEAGDGGGAQGENGFQARPG